MKCADWGLGDEGHAGRQVKGGSHWSIFVGRD